MLKGREHDGEGNPSADLTIACDPKMFRVHQNLLSYRSLVFRAMLNSGLREAREGEIIIKDMDSTIFHDPVHKHW